MRTYLAVGGVLTLITLLTALWLWPSSRQQVFKCGGSVLATTGFYQQLYLLHAGDLVKYAECFSSHIPFWDRNIEEIYLPVGSKMPAKNVYKLQKLIWKNWTIEAILSKYPLSDTYGKDK